MTPRILFTVSRVASLAAMLSLPISPLAAQEIGPPAPADAAPGDFAPPPAAEGVEVMTRGVIHEAFAEVVTDPKPGLIVSKRPPEAIDEVPPEFKPEEEGAIWITGYWAWDDERDDYFWQSGVWRVPPPGMRWVAGYWNEIPGGWQWVSGFWVPAETEEIRYYDAPPASLEAGPTSPAPSDNFFWATGSWNYSDVGYRWQPGYWAPYQENWVWISPRYVWTPAGYVYLPGRWDFRLTRRGCLFAPVYFTQPVYLRPSYVYRPWCALNTPNLFVHLWVRPNYGHFYFGNYYGSNWGSWGVTPWCQYRPYRNCYDPMLTQLQCHYRQSGVNYIGRLDGWHNHYASNVSARPAQTWNEQVRIVNNTNINNTSVNNTNINNTNINNTNINNKSVTNITNITNVKQNILAVNLQDASKRKDLTMKFAHLDGNQQKQAINLAKETRDVRQHRISFERPAGIATDLAKVNGGKGNGNKPDLSKIEQRGPRPGSGQQVRLKLPATQVVDAGKQKERVAPPPKLTRPDASNPKVELHGDPSKIRDDGRGPIAGPKPKGVPQPKVELPDGPPKTRQPRSTPKLDIPNPQPKIDAPKPQPKVEIPRPQPKIEVPQPKPNKENPVRQPRIETPRPQPRIKVPQPQPKVELPKAQPQPKVELPRARMETPRERPQIKLDIPRPAVRVDPAPRAQPAPRVETPKPDAPKHEPRHGGENQPQGGRKNKP